MRSLYMLVAIGIVSWMVSGAAGEPPIEPPSEWELFQNDPDPFMLDLHGACRFTVVAPQSAHLELVIWSPDSTRIVKPLWQNSLPAAGLFTVAWDGKDSEGNIVREGTYPYTLRATTGPQGMLLFEDSRRMRVSRVTGVEPGTWTVTKGLFR